MLCVNAYTLAVTADTLKTNNAVNLCKKCVIRTLANILARMNVCSALLNKDVASQYKLTVCTLNAKTL